MPIEFIPIAKMPAAKRNRKSKIEASPEWQEVAKAIQKGLPKDTSIRLTLSDATKKLFKTDRAASSFLLRLRKQFKDYQIRMIQGEIYITKLATHIGRPSLRAAQSEDSVISPIVNKSGKPPEEPK